MVEPYSLLAVKTTHPALHMQPKSVLDGGKLTPALDLKSEKGWPVDPLHATSTRSFSVRILHFGNSSEAETDPNWAIRKKYRDNLVPDTYDGLNGLKDGQEVSSATKNEDGNLTCSEDG
ncbi:unnamed protein product [Cuscuta epithymum]|uniref:Uncharacterized protein n=1 Tax=Cuscuta epithymum TaxID=186058 RepID=A0AAV0CX22_9ASTE|nr:unnamed protein product [Cuscuta epithymum]